jgi:uncharacterized membrane protein
MNDDPAPPVDDFYGKFQDISDLHAQHYRKATPIQRYLDRIVATLSHPALLMVLTSIILAWVFANLTLVWLGAIPFDPPPFQWLQGAASVTAVYIAALILTTQRREDGLTRHRDQLTLELAILSDRKSAKIIALLEEFRRDNPLIQNRVDNDATAMAKPANPAAVLNAIEEVHRTITEEKG